MTNRKDATRQRLIENMDKLPDKVLAGLLKAMQVDGFVILEVKPNTDWRWN